MISFRMIRILNTKKLFKFNVLTRFVNVNRFNLNQIQDIHFGLSYR